MFIHLVPEVIGHHEYSTGETGNALGVRIPAFVAKKAHLKPDDLVDFELLDSGEIMLKPVRKPRLTLEERVAEITDDNRHDETDWGDIEGQETW